jgi:hypothetical protein
LREKEKPCEACSGLSLEHFKRTGVVDMKKISFVVVTTLLLLSISPRGITSQMVGVDITLDLTIGIPWSDEFNPYFDDNKKRNEENPDGNLDGGDKTFKGKEKKDKKDFKDLGHMKP